MFKKIKGSFYIISLIIFMFVTIKYYISEKNIIKTNRSVSSYSIENINIQKNLPLLENDTDNIIDYKNDLEEFKSGRKKRIWESLISDQDE